MWPLKIGARLALLLFAGTRLSIIIKVRLIKLVNNLKNNEGDEIHLFSAPEGTKPIYSDKTSKIERLQTIGNELKRPTLYSAILFAVLIVVNIFLPQEGLLFYGIAIVTILTLIALIFSGMPYIGYQYRLRKLRRQMELYIN